jgi:hypothetical protein
MAFCESFMKKYALGWCFIAWVSAELIDLSLQHWYKKAVRRHQVLRGYANSHFNV